MKKGTLTEQDVMNWWLEKYHNTNCDEVVKRHPRLSKTIKWYLKYQVTSEQYDEWREWAVTAIMKDKGYSRKRVERAWWAVELNTSPSVKNESE